MNSRSCAAMLILLLALRGHSAIVTSLADDGSGSLRQAVDNAAVGETISFSISGVIALATPLMVTRDLQIRGPGSGALRIYNASWPGPRAFYIGSGRVVISDLTIGSPLNNSGSLVLSNVVIRIGYLQLDDDILGGAIQNHGTLVLSKSSVVWNLVVGRNVFGGAIYNDGIAVIDSSTVAGNCTEAWESALGAAIYNVGELSITNSTLDGNLASANDVADAGAIYSRGTLVVDSSTIAFNRASVGNEAFTGGIVNEGSASLHNSIVFNKNSMPPWFGGLSSGSWRFLFIGADVSPELGEADLAGPFTSRGHNLIGTTEGATGFAIGRNGDQIGDPGLAPLDDYGGNTMTHALLAGSKALNTGDPREFPSTDQRGVARPLKGRPDKGAFESERQGQPRESHARPLQLTMAGATNFARSLAMDDRTLVVGIEGGVTVYEFSNGVWSAPQFLATSFLEPAMSRIAVDGDTIIVLPELGSLFGKVHVFERATASWALAQTIDTPSELQDLNETVALKGDTFVVGANGVVHIFSKTSSKWEFRQTVDPLYSWLGWSSAAGDNILAVADGAYVRLLERSADGIWVDFSGWGGPALPLDPGQYNVQLCASIAIAPDTRSVVAAMMSYTPGLSSVELNRYVRSGEQWILESVTSAGTLGNYMPDIATSGSITAIGIPLGTGSDLNGRVDLFRATNGKLSRYATLTQPRPAPYDCFGANLAMSRDWLAVTAPFPGTVYLYDLSRHGPGREEH